MIANCDWTEPGRAAYTGTPRAAISALATIPAHVRAVLIERAERHDYDDVVFIDRDSVRGKHEYDPSLRFMAFGAGRICVGVDRSKWAADRVESGMVFCEGAFCIVRPSVCNNWAILYRIPVADRPPQPTLVPPGAEPPPELIAGPPSDPPHWVDLPAEPPEAGYGYGGWATASPYFGHVFVVPRAPGVHVPAIPEPSTYSLLLGGVAALAIWRKRAALQEVN